MSNKTRILPFLIVLLYLLYSTAASAQYLAPRLSVHVINPVSLMSKGGLKLQYRLSLHHSVLAAYRKYWGFFPGYQGSIEYHRYFRSWERSEAFIYGKAGMGRADYTPKSYYKDWQTVYNAPGGYLFAGAGLGKRYNFGAFFIEGNAGLKFVQPVEKVENYNRSLFYTLGPGSFVDCGLTLGFQFFNEERNMYRRTLGVRRPTRYR